MKIDHILIRVENLKSAVSDFENAGFQVYYGNNKDNCHHAMIYFQDRSFLELIDQTKFPPFFRFLSRKGVFNYFGILFKRFAKYCTSKEQFLDFSIICQNIDQFHKTSKSKSKLLKMKRKNHLNEIVQWKLFAFKQEGLPFVMSEYTPSRFPEEKAFVHQNNVVGIKQIDVSVENPEKYISDFNDSFGINSSSLHIIEMGSSRIKIQKSKHHSIKQITLLSVDTNTSFEEKLKQYNIKFIQKKKSV
ncbi:VOC family protein [Tenacibaculum sp. nBUS_03]|uniref:VOC family protein n=1 Tax=Tenacibaculum sp. nBUS_03 TaxID=3395320 RepID=UPI003EBF5CE6